MQQLLAGPDASTRPASAGRWYRAESSYPRERLCPQGSSDVTSHSDAVRDRERACAGERPFACGCPAGVEA